MLKAKANWKRIFFLFFLGCLAFFLIRAPKTEQAPLAFNGQNPSRDFVFRPPSNTIEPVNLIFSEAFGSVLNLDWYDVCFTNGTVVSKSAATSTSIAVGVTLFPLGINQSLLALQQGLDFFQSPDSIPGKEIDRAIYGRKVLVPPSDTACEYISAKDGGFEYSLFLDSTTTVEGTEYHIPTTIERIDKNTPFPLDSGSALVSRQLSLGSTTLAIRADLLALYLKRLLFVVFAWGLWEAILKIVASLWIKSKDVRE